MTLTRAAVCPRVIPAALVTVARVIWDGRVRSRDSVLGGSAGAGRLIRAASNCYLKKKSFTNYITNYFYTK